MPKVIIDRRAIEVPGGTKIITAAEQLGIVIPRFCFHPALGAVGACRVCAVKFLEGPVKGIQMSCMIDAHDGMVVATDDPEAVDFRRQVIEWLMISHPHDCPVCDEGGHCLLQDMTVAGGHGRRRYPGPKRTHVDQYLGPLVQHEMNRCIQCYRCSRFYQEYAGGRDLGVMSIASRVYFGRYQEGILESPFTGNLADICPTGVYTDKPSRYTGRRWDYERSPGLCIHCSLGCNTLVNVRFRRVVRQEARYSEQINGHFICDRGRHGYVYAGSADRPRTARVDRAPASMDAALAAAAGRLDDQTRRHGPGAVALWGSPRASLETLAAMLRLSHDRGWPVPIVFDDAPQAAAVRRAVALESCSPAWLESADFILMLAADPLNEAPLTALAVRQAVRKGAAAICLDPRPVALPCDVAHHPLSLPDIETIIGEMAEGTPEAGSLALELRHRLQNARRPAIVYSAEWLSPQAVERIGRIAAGLNTPGLLPLLPGANAWAASLVCPKHTAEALLAQIEAEQVRALVLVENDPFAHFPDRERLTAALGRLEVIVTLDYLHGPAAELSHIFLPVTTLYDSGGIWVSQAGLAQWAMPGHHLGLPIDLTNGGSHPPRRYDLGLPGSDPAPAWRLLGKLLPETDGAQPPDRMALLNWLGTQVPAFEPLLGREHLPAEGLRLGPAEPFPEEAPASEAPLADRFDLLAAPVLFGGEELADRSPQLRELERPPVLAVNPQDARASGLSDGDEAVIDTGRGTIRIPVAVREGVAPGTLVLPRHRRINWQQMTGRRQLLDRRAVRKV